MEPNEKKESRNKESAINWLNFDSFNNLLTVLRYHGHLNDVEIATLFEAALKDEPNLDQDKFLILNNLHYIVMEIQDALGDDALDEIIEINLLNFIELTMDM